MWIRRGFAFISATALFFLATNASADEFCHCNADVQSCYCPSSLSSPYDSCDSMDVSNMVTPDDPIALRDAANIQMTYDSETDTYTITADVRGLNAGGALPLHSNRGQWGSVSEFRNYMADLLGQEYPLDCFQRVQMKQIGTVRRIDQSEGELAAKDSMHVVMAAITGPSGEIVIDSDGDGSTLDQNFVTLGGRVINTDSQCEPETSGDGNLTGQQCSFATQTEYHIEWVGKLCDPQDDVSAHGAFAQRAGGRLFDPAWEGTEAVGRCVYWDPPQDPFKKCKAFLSLNINYDEAEITNQGYNNGTMFRSPVSAKKTDTDSVSSSIPLASGVCSSGRGLINGSEITPETKIGAPSDCHNSF